MILIRWGKRWEDGGEGGGVKVDRGERGSRVSVGGGGGGGDGGG